MTAHRLVDIHGVEARRVEAGEPHVAHEDELERIVRVAKPLRQLLASGLIPDVALPIDGIRSRSGHHDLHGAGPVPGAVPAGAKLGDFAEKLHADAPAHADDHPLAVHRLKARLEVLDDVLRHHRQSLLGPDHRLELGPLGLETFFSLDLLALRSLFEIRIDPRLRGLVERKLGQPALVVDRHRGPVPDRPLDVVDADVIAEDRPGVGVGQLDRRSGEADEGGSRQGVAHVPGESVDEVVLTAVGLVGDHHDVPPSGKLGVAVALLLGEELLDGGEDHAARGRGQQLAEVRPAFGLDRRLAEQVPTAGERAEELVIKVVPVREHDDRRVFHRRFPDDPAGVEGHGQALSRALGVPDDAHPPVSGLAARLSSRFEAAPLFPRSTLSGHLSGAQCFAHGRLDGVELVVSRHLLDDAAAVVLEHQEVAHEVEEPARRAESLDHDPHLRRLGRGQSLAVDRPPGLEPLAPRGEGPDARLDSVGDDERGVPREKRRDLRLVGLELLEGGPDRRLLVGRVLELQDRKRQAVYEQHDVRPPVVPVFCDRELIDRQPVVVPGSVEVDDARLRPADPAVSRTVLDGDAVRHEAMKGPIALDEVGPFGPGEVSARKASSSASAGSSGLSRASAPRNRRPRITSP